MIRAVLEGVIYSLFSILPAIEMLIGPTRTMKATGGFARSGLWRQMMADIFNREVVVPESFESSCLGAALLALYALGEVDTLDVVADMVGATHRHVPIPENVAVYAKLTPIYMSIPANLYEYPGQVGRRLCAHRRVSTGCRDSAAGMTSGVPAHARVAVSREGTPL
jgi:gluconokinase